MEFNIEGADAKTGRSRVVRIEAGSKQDAESKARNMGIMVSAIYEKPAPPEELELRDAPVRLPPTRSPVSHYVPETPVPSSQGASSSSTPRNSSVVSPEYAGLKAASVVLHALSILGYIIGPIVLVGGFFWGKYNPEDSKYVYIYGAFVIVGAAILHGMSASADALRDIARNSFNLRK
jgi:hypothetical protein